MTISRLHFDGSVFGKPMQPFSMTSSRWICHIYEHEETNFDEIFSPPMQPQHLLGMDFWLHRWWKKTRKNNHWLHWGHTIKKICWERAWNCVESRTLPNPFWTDRCLTKNNPRFIRSTHSSSITGITVLLKIIVYRKKRWIHDLFAMYCYFLIREKLPLTLVINFCLLKV